MHNKPDLTPLADVVERLRAPDGCPWDRVQSHESMRRHMIEEAYEVCDAIDREDARDLCDELGDVLYQIVFHASLAAEAGAFDLQDVIDGAVEKMKRRHPKLYPPPDGLAAAGDWESIKRAEKAARKQSPALAATLPVTMKLEKLLARLARCGAPESEILSCCRDEKEQATLALARQYCDSGEDWELAAQALAGRLTEILEKYQKS